MNTTDFGLFLPVMLAGSIGLTLFIIAGNRILNSFKKISSERMVEIRSNGLNADLRRKLPRTPNIICMLPMHQDKRPEQRLW